MSVGHVRSIGLKIGHTTVLTKYAAVDNSDREAIRCGIRRAYTLRSDGETSKSLDLKNYQFLGDHAS